jgi:ubiquinone/menaquinone biosynthesis C-methylase UbiE
MGSESRSEQYIHGHDDATIQGLSLRSASHDGAFFLPYLRPGMSLLDCGCGPGSITFGLAGAVAPGQVIGIDRADTVIEHATAVAQERGVTNVRFLVGNVYQLEFPDNAFDAVFAHALIQHLAAPEQAMQEMWRVLKPGGLVGIRAVDHRAVIVAPANPLLDQYLDLWERFWQHNGGNPRVGGELKQLLRQSGFVRCEATASFDYAGTPEAVRKRAEIEMGRIKNPRFLQHMGELGWVNDTALGQMSTAWEDFSHNPDAFYAVARCEAVGWKG